MSKKHKQNEKNATQNSKEVAVGIKKHGVNDLPIDPRDESAVEELDQLTLSPYYHGLASFIRNCVTPMTIAVQGSWGSGKTSAINSTRQLLKVSQEDETKVSSIYINTWQYSMFDMDRALVMSVIMKIIGSMEDLLNKLKLDGTLLRNYDEKIKVIKKGIMKYGRHVAVLAGAVKGYDLNPLFQASLEDEKLPELTELRDKFTELVADYCEDAKTDRIVFFIDDLDRLDPARAVEILEVIKVLLDVENTVFVLAIDFDIVKLGVSQKYDADNLDEPKARSFFDKIVQVPFNMPTNAIDASKLIEGLLEAGPNIPDPSKIGKYQLAISLSLLNNPRSIKRLFNSFTLACLIANEANRGSEPDLEDGTDSLITKNHLEVFVLMCFQVAYPAVYENFATKLTTYLTADDEAALPELQKLINVSYLNIGTDAADPFNFRSWGLPPNLVHSFTSFIPLLKSLFLSQRESDDATEGARTIDWSKLQRCMTITDVTSSNSPATTTTESVQNYTVKGRLEVQGITGKELEKHPMYRLEQMITKEIEHDPKRYPEPVCFGGLGTEYEPRYSCYFGEKIEEIQTLGPRLRRKFLGISHLEKSVQIGFGLWQPDQEVDVAEVFDKYPKGVKRAEHLLRANPDIWGGLVERLCTDHIPDLSSPGKSARGFGFTLTAGAMPIVIKGISTEEHFKKVLELFPTIYTNAAAEQGIDIQYGQTTTK